MAFCSNCGTLLAPDDLFCAGCGNDVRADNAESLARLAQEQQVIPAPPIPPTPRVAQVAPQRRSLAWVWALAAVLLLVVGVGITGVFAYRYYHSRNSSVVAADANTTKTDTQPSSAIIVFRQGDYSEFPKVRLYYDITDSATGEPLDSVKPEQFQLLEALGPDDKPLQQKILSASKLNEKEPVAIDVVADVSGSMGDEGLIEAQNGIYALLQTVQFDKGDQMELMSFSDQVYVNQQYTSDESALRSAAEALQVQGQTALYDALYMALGRTAAQSGARCVIAYTDGQDNASTYTKDQVIALANHYGLPVYLIGVGPQVDSAALTDLAQQCGGAYYSIDDAGGLGGIYDQLFKEQKQQIMIEYLSTNAGDRYTPREVTLNYQDKGSNCKGSLEMNYTPVIVQTTDKGAAHSTAIDALVGAYLQGVADAVSHNDYSYLQNDIEAGSPLDAMQRDYVVKQKATQERLISYEITSMTFDTGDENTAARAVLVVHEVYNIAGPTKPAHVREFSNTYTVSKSTGDWLMYQLNKLVIL